MERVNSSVVKGIYCSVYPSSRFYLFIYLFFCTCSPKKNDYWYISKSKSLNEGVLDFFFFFYSY